METLISYLVKPLTSHPDEVKISSVEGSAAILLELRVHPDDVAAVCGEDSNRFRAIQQILSAASGKRKPVLELIEYSADAGAEE